MPGCRAVLLTTRLLLFAALLLGACSIVDDPPEEEEEAEFTLRELAPQNDIEIGAAAATGLPTSDATYADVLSREFGMLAAENAVTC